MHRLRLFTALCLAFLAGSFAAPAQDRTEPDAAVSAREYGDALHVKESRDAVPAVAKPFSGITVPAAYRAPLLLPAASGFPFPETPQERFMRVNRETKESVMKSVDSNLDPYRFHLFTEGMSEEWAATIHVALFFARLLLTPQFSVPYGYVALDQSGPLTPIKTPGWAPDPYSGMYSPENIPQCIRTEYDSATGTYKQVMVDWKIVEGYKYNLHPAAGVDVKPVPAVHFNSVEQQVFGR